MDFALKLIQIIFYITASIVTVLTFLKAKNGLLNTVNTEYQKKVIERLTILSDTLWDEFDFSSENHWSKNNDLKETMEKIHVEALKFKHEILTGKWEFHGVPMPKKQIELMALLERLKSDPFIPHKIREKIIGLLDNRIESMFEAYTTVIKDYQDGLKNGKYWDSLDDNYGWISNKILGIMIKNKAGITDLQNSAHDVRLEIQNYFHQFNPIKLTKF